MKSSIKPSTVERSGNFNETKFGIKGEEDMVYIFEILRNKLYSDKVMAVLREYSTNAMDSHVESGQPDKPITVTLPTSLDPQLKIRDYGEGLSENDIREVYCMYGRSTKRNSNEFTGQLGLGCKSGFAYGENFLITSYHGGTKTTYNAFIDETRVGAIAKISEEATWQTGIEITIPVNRADVSSFREKAEKCFKYFRVTPEIKGADIDLTKRDVILSGDGWRHVKGYSGGYGYRGHSDYAPVTAVMGNIGYPIKLNNMTFSDNENDIRNLLHNNFEVEFPIGSLNIGANREDLEYDKFTTVNIKRKIESIIADIRDQINEKISNSKTMTEAVHNANQLLFTSQLGDIFSDSKKNLTWRNVPIKSIYFNKAGKDVKFTRFHFNGKTCKREDVDQVAIQPGYVLVNKDIDNGWVIRCRQYLIDNDASSVYLVEGDVKGWCKEHSFKMKEDMINLSSIEKPIVVRTKNGPAKPRDSATAFTVDENVHRWGTQGDNWTQTSIDKSGSGIYVSLFKFEIQDCSQLYNATSLRTEVIPALTKLGFKEETHPIFGVKSSQVEKLGEGWVKLSDYIVKVFSKKGKLNDLLKDASSSHSASNTHYHSMFDNSCVLSCNEHVNSLDAGLCWNNKDEEHALTSFLSVHRKINQLKKDVNEDGSSLQSVYKLLSYFPELKDVCSVTDYQSLFDEKAEALVKAYPLLGYIHSPSPRYGRTTDENRRKEGEFHVEIRNYIETVDNCGL